MAFSSHERPGKGATDTWLTPPWLLQRLGRFDRDPCPPNGTYGLDIEWNGRVWLNPPYSKNFDFMKKMSQHKNGMALVFTRTETKWFQNYVFPYAHSILFFNKRLKFYKEDGTESKGNAGAPSVLISYTEYDTKMMPLDLGFLITIY
jgi:hypothetical protein